MRNKRQLTAALMIAAILGTAMPLSADMGGSQKSTCAFIVGMAEKAIPDHAITKMLERWLCE
jgi:hypothetical protein